MDFDRYGKVSNLFCFVPLFFFLSPFLFLFLFLLLFLLLLTLLLEFVGYGKTLEPCCWFFNQRGESTELCLWILTCVKMTSEPCPLSLVFGF